MSLDLRNFVQVNIRYHTAQDTSVKKGIATLITKNTIYGDNPFEGMVFKTFSQFEIAKEEAGIVDTSLDIYVKSFFENKGRGLQIIGGYSGDDVAEDIKAWIVTTLKALSYGFVIIISDADEAVLREVALACAAPEVTRNVANPLVENGQVQYFTGINEKVFISSTTSTSLEILNPENLPNYVVKIGPKGIESLTAAFLSRIDVQIASTISDYNFTIEELKSFTGALVSDNDTGVNLINNNFNFDTELVNQNRNIGGNTIGGADITNYYVRILLTQNITEAVLRLLASKIRFNQSGINRVMNVISQEMATYTTNGYLNTEFIWTEDDLYYTYNGVDYLVCSRNTPLTKGYKCAILPLSSLTAEQKAKHAFPPIYILLADQVSVRAILIEGDVY